MVTQVTKQLRRRRKGLGAAGPVTSPRRAARTRTQLDRLLDAPLFRDLSDPTRLGLLACLIKCSRPCAVGELAACCDVDLSVVSRHLTQLARAGLIRGEKRGRELLYSPCSDDLAATLRGLDDAADEYAAIRACGPDCCPLPAALANLGVIHKEPRS